MSARQRNEQHSSLSVVISRKARACWISHVLGLQFVGSLIYADPAAILTFISISEESNQSEAKRKKKRPVFLHKSELRQPAQKLASRLKMQ